MKNTLRAAGRFVMLAAKISCRASPGLVSSQVLCVVRVGACSSYPRSSLSVPRSAVLLPPSKAAAIRFATTKGTASTCHGTVFSLQPSPPSVTPPESVKIRIICPCPRGCVRASRMVFRALLCRRRGAGFRLRQTSSQAAHLWRGTYSHFHQ